MKLKPLVAGALFIAAAMYLYYPNPLWTTGRLIGALDRKNEMHRLIAAGELGGRAAKDPDRVISALTQAMGDDWDEVRGTASAALCNAGSAAVPHLERALKSDSALVRDTAYLTLECVKRERK